MMSVYLPLQNYLYRARASCEVIELEFPMLEQLLERDLPRTARVNSAWWSNNSNHHSQAVAWLDAGYVVKNVDLARERVTFSRNGLVSRP